MWASLLRGGSGGRRALDDSPGCFWGLSPSTATLSFWVAPFASVPFVAAVVVLVGVVPDAPLVVTFDVPLGDCGAC